GSTTFNITVTPVNDAPTLTHNTGATVFQGSPLQITNALLQVADVEQFAADLTYTLTSPPLHGTLFKFHSPGGLIPLAANETFTQADIDANRITYINDNLTADDDSFAFTVNDGAGGSIPETTFSITVDPVPNTSPMQVHQSATFAEGVQDV